MRDTGGTKQAEALDVDTRTEVYTLGDEFERKLQCQHENKKALSARDVLHVF